MMAGAMQGELTVLLLRRGDPEIERAYLRYSHEIEPTETWDILWRMQKGALHFVSYEHWRPAHDGEREQFEHVTDEPSLTGMQRLAVQEVLRQPDLFQRANTLLEAVVENEMERLMALVQDAALPIGKGTT